MKILIIGSMHGNEPLGPQVIDLLTQVPIDNVDTIIANERAYTANKRFIGEDLNRSFPGNPLGKNYESKRAAELLGLCSQYDVVFDFHNTHCPENDCGFVGQTAPESLYDISAALGLDRVIVADYDCINKYAPNCLSIEISLSSPAMNAKLWYAKILALSKRSKVPKSISLKKFRFAYRMTLDDAARLDLRQANLKAFQPIPDELATAMNVKNPAYPIFIADEYTPYNYGGLLNTR